MKIKIYLDGANVDDMAAAAKAGVAAGFTTNPTLMRKSGVSDYEIFAKQALGQIRDLPVSFEVFADDLPGMAAQARRLASLGDNVYVKIPVMNTAGVSTASLIKELTAAGLKLNVTAVFTEAQVKATVEALAPGVPAVISVFAGRIADTGRDPMPMMRRAVELAMQRPHAEVLWASPREVLNVYQADECGCHIITVANDLLSKLSLRGKDLLQYSQETVRMFFDDATKSRFSLKGQIDQHAAVAE